MLLEARDFMHLRPIAAIISVFLFLATMAPRPTMAAESSCYPTDLHLPQSMIDSSLQEPACTGSTTKKVPIYLFGEDHDDDRVAGLAREYVLEASKQGTIFTFAEGEPYVGVPSGLQRNFGLSTALESYVWLEMYLTTARMMLNPQFKDARVANVIDLDRLSTQALIALGNLKTIWGNFPKYDDSQANILADKIRFWLENDLNRQGGASAQDWVQGYRGDFLNIEAFSLIILGILTKVEDHLLSQPEFAGVDRGTLQTFSLGPLRELGWIRIISKHICQAKDEGKPVWIHVGRGHRSRLKCLLKSLVKDAFEVFDLERDDVATALEGAGSGEKFTRSLFDPASFDRSTFARAVDWFSSKFSR